ncbi:MAG: hypothetical protein Q8L36_03095 [bacterium]|nr:hypothetical protein [bacterium]
MADPKIENKKISISVAGKKAWFWIALTILFVLGGFFGWENYWSPEARGNRETQKNYQKYLDWEKGYNEAMKNDTYGGKTPQETLNMFIEALKAGDTELASKYFVLTEKEGNSRAELKSVLDDKKRQDNLEEIISVVSRAKPDNNSSYEGTAWFVLKNEQGLVEYSVVLKLNKESGVWKIESL